MFYNLCYTFNVVYSSRPYWFAWTQALQEKGFKQSVAWLLDVAGPLNLLGAQALYIASPLFDQRASLCALASLLENEQDTQAFLELLRGN
ncbi:MAG: hypothetical protein CO094_07355 [Anaerolineae bacterium CG_4_9_14_3_um_filter_57_17]|nr:hypothetical protein [bacterium]NCT21076.1 hypothetical protein [bacterium]OIO87454.1 MAG: hypothetical protein AUK01_00075 [Anaerolineae bacterium CG2_30_57_67]PJB66397.1 MAG: hypothetical protein CO094_07355 [Anaerolineae bacterium CG_4_9_14_3_um_filter_57_17]